MNNKPSALAAIVTFWTGAIWTLGLWLKWWHIGGMGIIVVILSSGYFFYLAFASSSRRQSPPIEPTSAIVDLEMVKLTGGQRRTLRNVIYSASESWPVERADTDMWVGLTFYVESLNLIIRLGTKMILDREDTTVEGLKAYAERFYRTKPPEDDGTYPKLAGSLARAQGVCLPATIIKNEIILFKGQVQWLLTEYSVSNPWGGVSKARRYSFAFLGSEYCIQFTSATERSFEESKRLFDFFLDGCAYYYPNLKAQHVCGGRIQIGVPMSSKESSGESNWECFHGSQATTVLRSPDGLATVKLNLAPVNAKLQDSVFEVVPGYLRMSGYYSIRYRMEDAGLTILLYHSQGGKMNYTLDAVELPSGQIVVMETQNYGADSQSFNGFFLEPLKRAMIASLRDVGI